MKGFILLFLTLNVSAVGTAQAASLRTNDSQQFTSANPARNYVKNSGAEKNDLNITDADNIVSRNTASTPILKGDAQFGVDADASGEKACWVLDPLQGEMEGNAVASFMFRGDASLYKAYVQNDTDTVRASAERTLVNASTKQDAQMYFVANPAKTYSVCVEATGNAAAAFVMDDVSVRAWETTSVDFGTYSPTISAGVNAVSPSAPAPWTYSRIGNVVTVSGRYQTGCTSAADTYTVVQATLPIATTFGPSDPRLSGFTGSTTGQGIVAEQPGGSRAQIQWACKTTSIVGYRTMFQYTLD